MAKLSMQKLEVVALLRDAKNMVERLQRRGAVELIRVDDAEIVRYDTDATVAQLERNIAAVHAAMEYLNRYTGHKESLLASLSGREAISTAEFAERKKDTEKTLSACHAILGAVKAISDGEAEQTKLQTELDLLHPWETLDLPLNFKGTKTTRCFIGTLPGEWTEDMAEKEIFGEMTAVSVRILAARKEQTRIAVLCLKSRAGDAEAALRDAGFAAIQESGSDTAAEKEKELNRRIAQIQEEREAQKASIVHYGESRREMEFLLDFLTMRRDKYLAAANLGTTEKTVILRGYIPKIYAKGLVEEFEQKYTAVITLTEPDAEDDVPVLLKNGKFSEPVEGITEMYALPGKRDVDPSAVMAFFYYLFFGMMLSDAGYGLVTFIATSIILKKTAVEGTLRRSIKMFWYCSISTLFWGILFGSWFGDLPQIIASNYFGVEIATTALWFEPLDKPILLLLFSFGLGICHLLLGESVHFSILWNEGKKKDAFFDFVPIVLFVLGVAPLGASILTEVPPMLTTVGMYLLIAGVAGIILTAGRESKNPVGKLFGGVYGLYNSATGYLSDILSYSRLLALGLATGSIAGVINLIATMPENMVVKTIMLVVVGVVGHTANMGVNLLGAYVHADRLQFVELFSKFYEGGGRAFQPLKANTKYFKFKKENIYE